MPLPDLSGPPPSPPGPRLAVTAIDQRPVHSEESRKAIRAALRHPLENFALVVVILVSVAIVGASIAAVIRAAQENTTPDPYAVLFTIAPLVLWLMRGQLLARMRLGAVKVTASQYPEAHAMVAEAAAFYGLRRAPEAYVVLGNGMINAAASGHGFRRFIFVYSDLFEVGGRLRNPDALRFIIAHEVGHIAAGHTSYWRWLGVFAGNIVPFLGSTLSRSQEYTADNFGYAFCPQGSPIAMSTLAAGKYLNGTVDINTIADRAEEEKGFFVWLVNALASHPVLAWRAHALRDRSAPGRLLWRPRGPKTVEPRPTSHYSPVTGPGPH